MTEQRTSNGFAVSREAIDYVLLKLAWMREHSIWPNGRRYLWTDAFGVILLVSLYRHLDDKRYLNEAKDLVAEVERVLGQSRGLRIGEADDRDGQYFHYLAMWMYALAVLGHYHNEYRDKGVALAREVHRAFVVPGQGVLWKMADELAQPYPGYGFGMLDAFDGYVSYRLLDEQKLHSEISQMRALVERDAPTLTITQDLGLGMMLWMSHFFPDEPWANKQRNRCLATLDSLWQPTGYFAREPELPEVRIAFANYGVSIGLQAVNAMSERVQTLHRYFDTYRSGDDYDREAITHVMACCAHFPGYLTDFPPATT